MTQGDEMTEWPDVAVVVATRDRPELLREALAAIRDQDYPGRVRTVVVYDQSEPDPSLESGELGSVRVVRNTRTPGLAGSRNTGVLATDSELVAFCDDDDLWWRSRLRRQVEALRQDPDAVLVTSGIRVVYGDETTTRRLERDTVHRRDLIRSRLTELHPSTFLLTRRGLDRIGLVDEELPGSYAEDYDLLLRAAQAHPVRNVREPLVDVRWHPRSYFSGRWAVIASALTWLLDRHPDFRDDRRGEARVRGQIAFALAGAGRRRAALGEAARALRRDPRERRSYLAVAVAAGIVRPEQVLRALNRRGRSV